MNELVEYLRAGGLLHSQRVADAMTQVDRAFFSGGYEPHVDTPLPIGFDATISAPHMHAYAMEKLEPVLKPEAKILDIGSGSGYLVAAFSTMMDYTGRVIGVEHIEGLNRQAIRNVTAFKRELLDEGKVAFVTCDSRYGYPAEAPYDGIHIGAATPMKNVLQLAKDQLKPGGIIVAPAYTNAGEEAPPPSSASYSLFDWAEDFQEMVVVRKSATTEEISVERPGTYVRFVPLTDASPSA